MKMKEFGPRGGRASLAPANDVDAVIKICQLINYCPIFIFYFLQQVDLNNKRL